MATQRKPGKPKKDNIGLVSGARRGVLPRKGWYLLFGTLAAAMVAIAVASWPRCA